MDESKPSPAPVSLKRSRLGPNLKTLKVLRPVVPNGNGLSTSNEKKIEEAPENSSSVDKDKASMSVRNKEICRLHMEETNSINNAQNPDAKGDKSESNDLNKSDTSAADVVVKKEPSDPHPEENNSNSTVENSCSATEQNNSGESDSVANNCVSKVNSTSSEESSKTSEENGKLKPSDEASDDKVEKITNEEIVKAEIQEDSASSDASKLKDSSQSEAVKPVKEPSAKTEVSKPVKESPKAKVLKKEAAKTDVPKPADNKVKVEKDSVKSEEKAAPEVAINKTETKSEKDLSTKAKGKTEAEPAKRESARNKANARKGKLKDEESQSSGSEDFLGFDSEHTEKSMKAKKKFIESSEEKKVSSSRVPSTPVSTDTSKSENSFLEATPSSNKKMRKNIVDISDPRYLKPFEFGWRRELVYRATNEDGKRQGDIYYYTPSGKKVRSQREVSEHITDPELTADNFTFSKEPIGLNDSEKEIIRDAKMRMSKDFATPPPRAAMKTPKAKATATPPATPKTTPKVVIKTPTPSSGGLKVKFTGIKSGSTAAKSSVPKSRPAKVKKRKSSGSSELEMGMLPPMWSSPEAKNDDVSTARSWSPPTVSDSSKNVGKKRSAERGDAKKGSPPSKRARVANNSDCGSTVLRGSAPVVTSGSAELSGSAAVVTTTTTDSSLAQLKPSHYFMMNLAAGYSTLMHIFRYLNLKELLVASRVCRLWHDVASKQHFWQTVRMKNTQVSDWKGFANALIKHETKHLDLRKMLVGTKTEEVKNNWLEFYNVIGQVKSLKRIELCRCLSSVIENLAKHVPHIEALTATSIKNTSLNLEPLAAITNLTELRLKGMSGIELSFNHLSNLTTLKLLSITGIKNLDSEASQSIGSLVNLEQLEIGDCNNIHQVTVTEALPKLINLKRLRLEKGQNSVPLIIQLIESASQLPALEILELINFDVKPGFEEALKKCTNIKSLLMIPTYITQSATTNHIVMVGVSHLKQTLKNFVWGLTLELLRVTDLFIDQCETAKNSPAQSPTSNGSNASKKGKGDSIPILKPLIDTLEEGRYLKEPIQIPSTGPSKVDILPIPKLRKVLSQILPTTEIKILKIPFNQTWRQTLV
ncbi:unnamed protein product [Bemisia tabaci]|uniref:MBD domain-containing protein n=1 Tax=Bemisia tabaci TaxID=7038 RepID=A0A9P0F5N9_BEMTA|nr:unnamed protein product [Bemisia tabaci]